ncbi:MAG TPA: tetratricopeptide repeat protein [Nitrospirota bacterium]|nr:tetratricopeptide repeat protein [Nitrospirota bacterium]
MRTLIIAMLLALPLFGCNSPTEERRVNLLKEKKTRPQDAPRQPYYYGLIEEYRGVLAEDPHNRAAIIALANAYYDSGNWRQAIVYYERALALDPHDADILTDLGTSYRNSGNPDRAFQYYQKALHQNPDHLNARYNLGIVYAYDRKDYAGAIREWEYLLRIAPTFPHAAKMRESIALFKKKTAGRGTP